jgi:hypothetical protein
MNTGTETSRIQALNKPTGVRKVKKSVAIKRVILQEHRNERNNG